MIETSMNTNAHFIVYSLFFIKPHKYCILNERKEEKTNNVASKQAINWPN